MTTPPDKIAAVNNALYALKKLRTGDPIPAEVEPLLEALRGYDWQAIREVADDHCTRKTQSMEIKDGKVHIHVEIHQDRDQFNRGLKRIMMGLDRKASEFGTDELTKAELLEILNAWYPKLAGYVPTSATGKKLWWADMGMKDKPQGRGNIPPAFRARLRAGR
jgi:hypothetical protein